MTLRDVVPVGSYADDHERTWAKGEEDWLLRNGARVLNGQCQVCHVVVSSRDPIPPIRTASERLEGSAKVGLWLEHLSECRDRQFLYPKEGIAWLLSPDGLDRIGRDTDAALRMTFWDVDYATGTFIEYKNGKQRVRASRTSKRRRLCGNSGKFVPYKEMPWHYSDRARDFDTWQDAEAFAIALACPCGEVAPMGCHYDYDPDGSARALPRVRYYAPVFHDHSAESYYCRDCYSYVPAIYRDDETRPRWAEHFYREA